MTEIGGANMAFRPTRWSLVRRAFGEGASGPAADEGRAALGELIDAYWKPVYAFVRRSGQPSEEAKDLTQAFFAQLLERGLSGADPRRGSFRSYLLGALKHFMTDAHRRAATLKRGGGQRPLSLEAAQQADLLDATDREASPEQAFMRRWAEEQLGLASADLRRELEASGRAVRYEVFRRSLSEASYAEIAEALGISVGDVTNHLHRARRRLGALLRARVLPSVASAGELEREVGELLAALAP